MRKLLRWSLQRIKWRVVTIAGLTLFVGTPAQAVDRNFAACLANIAASMAVSEGVNAGISAAAQAADVGMPVMDKGIVLSLNQVNGNLGAMNAELTSIARSTCDTNETLSNPASVKTFLGWVEADDVLPIPNLLSGQIDGTMASPLPLAVSAEVEDERTITKMSLDVKDGYFKSQLENEGDSLAGIEGLVLTSIAEEKKELLASNLGPSRIDLKLKAAGNINDLIAVQAMIAEMNHKATLRGNIIAGLSIAAQKEAEFREYAKRRLHRDDHLATAKILGLPI